MAKRTSIAGNVLRFANESTGKLRITIENDDRNDKYLMLLPLRGTYNITVRL